jgi:hypothetical protein
LRDTWLRFVRRFPRSERSTTARYETERITKPRFARATSLTGNHVPFARPRVMANGKHPTPPRGEMDFNPYGATSENTPYSLAACCKPSDDSPRYRRGSAHLAFRRVTFRLRSPVQTGCGTQSWLPIGSPIQVLARGVRGPIRRKPPLAPGCALGDAPGLMPKHRFEAQSRAEEGRSARACPEAPVA